MGGSVTGLSVIAGQTIADITITYGWLPGQPLASTALIVKLKVPDEVGVPVIAPVAGLSDSPLGSAPAETENVYGATPPEAETVWL